MALHFYTVYDVYVDCSNQIRRSELKNETNTFVHCCLYHLYLSDPYNLVPNTYMKWMFGVLFILNCFNVFELYKLYIMDDINAAFECTFQDGLVYGFDKQCVVYFELMGASTSVLLSMLFINTAVCRRPLERERLKVNEVEERHKRRTVCESQPKLSSPSQSIKSEFLNLVSDVKAGSAGIVRKHFGPNRESSLKNLEDTARDSKDDGVRVYFKFAIDVIKEVRESEAPAKMPNGFFKVEICGRKFYPPTRKWWGVGLLQAVFVFGLTLVSLFTHPTLFWNYLKDSPAYFVILLICYFCVAKFLFLHCTVMRRITLMLRKAYALMKISASPLHFIERRLAIEKMLKKKRKQNQRMEVEEKEERKQIQPKSDLSVADILKMPLDEVLKLQMNTEQNIPKPAPLQSETTTSIQNNSFEYYLNPQMRIVTPEFLRAWWALRNHIQQWELRYFYEVCFHQNHVRFLLFVNTFNFLTYFVSF